MTDDLPTDLDAEHAESLLAMMIRIRRFEERCVELYSAAKIRGFLHLYIGQEAVAAAAIGRLDDDDAVVATYRDHAHAIAKGLSMRSVMAEMYGRVQGCSRGRGGSMHLFDSTTRVYGGNAIVGGGLPVAAGLALADRLRGRDRVTACFFGEGAVAEGEFHETMNLAALWDLPVLFCCENNLYAMGTALSRSEAATDLATRASGYGMAAWSVDGMDVVASDRAVQRAVESIRGGGGPVFLEFRTYRFRAHSMYDPERYREKDEVAEWKHRDPIDRFWDRVRDAGLLTEDVRDRIEVDVAAEIDEAVAFAEEGTPEPVEELERWVYSDDSTVVRRDPVRSTGTTPGSGTVTLTYREALRAGLCDALSSDDRVFLMGEDIGAYGGCFAVSLGLFEEFGPQRVRDTPLSESAFVGAGIGAALGGMRPVVEIMTVNFALLALDQIMNNAATLLHMSGGQFNVPVVIRLTTGAGRQLAAQHSHSLEAWFAHIPGLRVVAPATVADARAMLGAALADPDPVLIFEHGALFGLTAELPELIEPVDLDHAATRRPGEDVTVVTHGASLHTSLEAAEQLAGSGIDVEVIDLRTLRPLDTPTILESVRRTGRLVVVEDGWRSGGIGAEIAARVAESAFWDLDSPIERVAAVEVPVPYAQHLEQEALVDVDDVVAAVRRAMG